MLFDSLEPEMDIGHRPKIQVVYYLSRNRQLEQPHFIEMPLVSPEGLYLRDVINKLNSLRGRGMASMYSWSCKRIYKNAFVWNDLGKDDLIVPAHENEYVLKGSELVEVNNSDCFAPTRTNKSQTLQHLAAPPSTTNIISKQTKMSHDDDGCYSLTTYKIYKSTHALSDASTQTDEHVKVQETRTRSVLTDNGDVHAACLSARKTNKLESLMKADNKNLSTLEECQVPTKTKHKAYSMLLQIISCGSVSLQDHDFSQALSYNSRSTDSRPSSSLFSPCTTLGELDCVSESPRFIGMRLKDKQYFGESSVETKFPNKEEIRSLNRSSSDSANRINKCALRLTCTKCIPRSIMGSLSKNSRIASMRLFEDSKSCTLSPCVSKKSSKKIETFIDDKDKNKIIKIEERLASGARVIIHLESNECPSFTR